MALIGELAVNVVARTGGMSAGLNRAQKDLGRFNSSIRRSIGLATSLLGVTGGFAGVGFAINLAAEAEQAKTAFSTMLGSVERGQQMFKDLQDFAASTPLQLNVLQDAARTLLSFGVAGDSIIPTLRMLGDAAGGDAERMKSLALVFGQVSSAGKLTGGDLMQMINAGFNPLNYIAKRTGETMAELRDRMSKGAIGIDEVNQAFQDATGPGGQFFQMMEKQSQTFAGRLSTLKDNIAALAMSIGEILLPAIGRAVDLLTGLVKNFTELDKSTQVNIVNIGLFVTAFVGAMMIIPKVIAVFRMLINAYKALATAQTIQQALSGPKGWAVLAASAVVAGVAVAGVNYAMGDLNNTLANLEQSAEETATGALPSVGKSAAESAQKAKQRLSQVRSEIEQINANLKKTQRSFDSITGQGSQSAFESIVKFQRNPQEATFQRASLRALEKQEALLERIVENTEEIADTPPVQINEVSAF
jgi:tape measure domain-containing protein